MYVSARFFNEKAGGYAGRDYTYRTVLPLTVGDQVLVPTGNDDGDKRALITAVNLPDDAVSPEWADRVKDITKYDDTVEQRKVTI